MQSRLSINAKQIIQLCYANWRDICAIPGLVDRDNPAIAVRGANNSCGEAEYSEADGMLMLNLSKEVSATAMPQIAYHGDYLVVLNNNKVLVVPCPEDATLETELLEDGQALFMDAEFEFVQSDFPLYSRWLHRNGNEYIILGYRNVPENGEKCRPGYPVKIDYANVRNGRQFGRAAHDWHRSMTRVG